MLVKYKILALALLYGWKDPLGKETTFSKSELFNKCSLTSL